MQKQRCHLSLYKSTGLEWHWPCRIEARRHQFSSVTDLRRSPPLPSLPPPAHLDCLEVIMLFVKPSFSRLTLLTHTCYLGLHCPVSSRSQVMHGEWARGRMPRLIFLPKVKEEQKNHRTASIWLSSNMVFFKKHIYSVYSERCTFKKQG